MDVVTVTSKYQIVIPQAVRAHLRLRPGQNLYVICYDNRLVLILLRPIQEARGSLIGIDTDIPREAEDRF